MQQGTENILLVDDEQMLLDIGRQLLSMLGYQVTATVNSSEALEMVKTEPNRFDLVITDQTMPELSGKELSQEIYKVNPGLPIILCTGFSNQVSESDAGQYGISAFCTKPLRIHEISEVIRTVLDS